MCIILLAYGMQDRAIYPGMKNKNDSEYDDDKLIYTDGIALFYEHKPYVPAVTKNIRGFTVIQTPAKFPKFDGLSKFILKDKNGYRSLFLAPDKAGQKELNLWIYFYGNGMCANDDAHKYFEGDNLLNNVYLSFEYPKYCLNAKKGEINTSKINTIIDDQVGIIKNKYNIKKINILAWSLGCAIGLNYAKNRKDIKNIVLLAPFTSLKEAITHILKGIPIRHVLKNKNNWDNIESVKYISPEKISIYHGTQDNVIPVAQGKLLYEELKKLNEQNKRGMIVEFREIYDAEHFIYPSDTNKVDFE